MASDNLPVTEQENPRTANLSSLSAFDIVRVMNAEDALVAPAVGVVVPDIGRAVEKIVERLRSGGRLFYVGTGTSGRLGVLDAAECPPTFGVSPELVQAVIAGGYEACYRAVEASEDDEQAGARDLQARGFTKKDALVGIAASGRTPYTIGALKYAREVGAFTAALTCTPGSPITEAAEIAIVPVVGPEVIAGSTRLKAGTAQKMVLNMISTATMRNVKLRARAVRILRSEIHLTEQEAETVLDAADENLPVALVMCKSGRSKKEAEAALQESRGVIANAVKLLSRR